MLLIEVKIFNLAEHNEYSQIVGSKTFSYGMRIYSVCNWIEKKVETRSCTGITLVDLLRHEFLH